jgi:hypothetical protein
MSNINIRDILIYIRKLLIYIWNNWIRFNYNIGRFKEINIYCDLKFSYTFQNIKLKKGRIHNFSS